MADDLATPAVPESTPAPQPAPADWRTYLTEDLKQDPIVSGWAEKASEKDVTSLIKGYAHASKRLGSAINLPSEGAKPEEVAALRTKLYQAGIFEAPPASPQEYGLAKPEALPEGVQWSEELAGKFASAMHKHGIPKSAVQDLLPLYLEAIGGQAQAFNVTKEQGEATLKAEYGTKYDELREAVTRMIPGIFKTKEEAALFEATGLANHPGFVSVLMRLAPLALADSSYMDALPHAGGERSGEDVREEMAKIMTDPSHPMHEGYKRQDPKVERYLDGLYRSAFGNQPAPIETGVGVS